MRGKLICNTSFTYNIVYIKLKIQTHCIDEENIVLKIFRWYNFLHMINVDVSMWRTKFKCC